MYNPNYTKTIMKRNLSSILMLMAAATMLAGPVSQQDAMQEAAQFLAARGHSAGGPLRQAARSVQLQPQGDAAYYYIFNIGDNGGFVVVSGDDRTNPILGYSDQGSYETGRMPASLTQWLDDYEQQLKILSRLTVQQADAVLAAPRRTPVATRHSISPLVTSHWDQATPYWNQCPQFMSDDGESYELAYTGCVATSMSQIMNYYKWPKTTTQVIPSYSFIYSDGLNYGTATTDALPVVSFDWDHMCDNYTGAEDSVYTQAVSQLMLYAGHAVKMQYGTSSSGAYTDDIPGGFLNYFGYDSNTLRIAFRSDYEQEAWDNLIYDELANGRPTIYNGTAGSGGGHSFVCDGYEYGDYFHINWGWGGMGDGYFQLAILNPNASGIGGAASGEGYNIKQNAIVGIKPDYSQGGGTGGDDPDNPPATKQDILTATNVTINYNATSATWERDSKSVGFSLYKSRYINVSFSDHENTGKKYRKGIALYNDDNEMVELIHSTSYFSTATVSASGELYQFGRELDSRSAIKWGKNLTGHYRIVPVSMVDGESDWKPMLESDRYYIDAEITNYSVTLTCHPVTSLRATAYETHGGTKVGQPVRVDVTIQNESVDRFFGNLYLWVDGEAQDATLTPFTTTVQAEVPAQGEKVVSFNFTPTSAGTKAIGVSTDDQGEKSLPGQGSITIEEATTGTMNLSVAIHAVGADEPAEGETCGKVYDSHVKWVAAITNNGEAEYNRYVLAPLFIVSKDEQGNVTGGSMVTYKQASLSLAAGETQEIPFEFDNLAYGSTYSLNVYARNDEPDDSEASHLTNLVQRGESRYYDIVHGLVTWNAAGERQGVKVDGNIVIPDYAVAASIEGLEVTSITPNDNPNTIYFVGPDETVPAQLQDKNVVQGNVAQNIDLNDGYPFFTPSTFTASHIAYHRVLTPMTSKKNCAGWEPLVLPFAVQMITHNADALSWDDVNDLDVNDLYVAEFAIEDADLLQLQYSIVNQMQACRPYLVALNMSSTLVGETITFQADNARVNADPTSITSGQSYLVRGTMVNTAPDAAALVWDASTGYYRMTAATNSMMREAAATVPAFRAWAECIDQGNPQALEAVLMDNISTGVTTINTHKVNDGVIYDLMGRNRGNATDLNTLPRGIYIINGVKIVK